ncbi:family 20 glycosylhydrolase [Streptomyces sp. NPDC057565]|uniref:family 20 glycosylhydrolase n=1 Tax=Streptomyces sp. NPDC057565 TaxID=3346169 RepID=UPI00369CEC7A
MTTPNPNTLLLPKPQHVAAGDGAFRLTRTTTLVAASSELLAPLGLFAGRLRTGTGIALPSPVVGGEAPGGVLAEVDPDHPAFVGITPSRGVVPSGEDHGTERHVLEVSPEGIRVTGASPAGVHRGLTTLAALAESAPAEAGAVELSAVHVTDGPALAWRGLSLDVVRTVFSADEVRRVIDLLDRYKFNVLHLHLTDDQGWRLETPSRPALTANAEPGTFFTRSQYADLVAYAAARFITVVPEIDMPGHSRVAIAACHGLSDGEVAPAPASLEELLAQVHDGSFAPVWLDPERAEVRSFVRDVLADLAAVTPGRYLHIGGDEAFGMPAEAHAAFVTYARGVVRKLGKEPVGWQETVRAEGGPGELVQFWIDDNMPLDPENPFLAALPPVLVAQLTETFAEAAGDADRLRASRARVIVSRTGNAYLDRPYAEVARDAEAESRRQRLGLPTYPPVTLEDAYTAPIPGIDTDEGYEVVGFEAAVWCETVTDIDDLTFLLLPRLPGMAERAWTPGSGQNWPEYRRRLAAQAPAWRRHGLMWFPAPSVDWH